MSGYNGVLGKFLKLISLFSNACMKSPKSFYLFKPNQSVVLRVRFLSRYQLY
ncbi:hypothetical protein [Helicobacter phage COL 23-PUJ]|nr:hypothetical protein [Helicobacter phage COL 23-PUJ]